MFALARTIVGAVTGGVVQSWRERRIRLNELETRWDKMLLDGWAAHLRVADLALCALRRIHRVTIDDPSRPALPKQADDPVVHATPFGGSQRSARAACRRALEDALLADAAGGGPVIVRLTPGAVTYRGGVRVLGDAILQLPGRAFTADRLDEAKEVAAGLLAGIARLEARH